MKMNISHKNIEDLSKLLIEEIVNRNLLLCTAESCTGGLLAKILTDMPGSSVYFKGGIVAYWNEIKNKVLKVKQETLNRYTAVSSFVAIEMAIGVRKIYQCDLSIAITGYAGPGLGERGEEPGLVYIAISEPLGTQVYEEHFEGDRDSIRNKSVLKAMIHTLEYIYEFNLRR